MQEEIVNLLENDSRLSPQDIAAMTGHTEDEVTACIRKMEKKGIILKYTAVINREKLPQTDIVSAIIQVKLTSLRDYSVDAISERIYRFPQVRTVHLISGEHDLVVLVTGENLKEVSSFVSEKLATLEGVRETQTHFILKTYKENGTFYVNPKKDFREGFIA